MNASLADSLGISANESLKTKIPLRQIVQFAERLQAQNLEVSCASKFQGRAELQKLKQENMALRSQCNGYDSMKAEIDQLREQMSIMEDLKAAIQTLEKTSLQETLDVMSIQLNYMPILQHELKCEAEDNQSLGKKIDDMKTNLQNRVKEMEDMSNAFDARLETQIRTINRLTKENNDLKMKNKEQSQKLELFLKDKAIADMGYDEIGKLLKRAALLKDVDQDHILFEKKFLQQIDKLKRENRNLLTEKIKLESDFWGKDYEASSHVQALENDLLTTKKSLNGLQLDLDIKLEAIENLQIERNELRQIKESLNGQVYSKACGIEKIRESLLKLSKRIGNDITELTSYAENMPGINDMQTIVHMKSMEIQTDDQTFAGQSEDVAKYQEKISELETEVTALTLYVTKMAARVSSNQNLQSALFFDYQNMDLLPPSPVETHETTPDGSRSPNSPSTSSSPTKTRHQQILKGPSEWIRGLSMFHSSQANPS